MVTSSSKKKKLDIRNIKKKVSEGLKLFKYEENYLRKWLVKENDKYTSMIVRVRDC